MSPSESEFRAFLHGGEGEPVNAGAVIAHAQAVRHTRRVRTASVAAAVIAVGAIGTGAFALNQDGGGRPTAGDAQAPSSHDHVNSGDNENGLPESPPPSTAPTTSGSGSTVSCPRFAPRLMLPGGGGTGQFGGDEPLFDGTIATMRICGYAGPATGGEIRFSHVAAITGAQAAEVATSLNEAPTRRVIGTCTVAQGKALLIYAKTASGADSKPVVITYSSCSSTATNGTAVRYNWKPPADVAAQLRALTTPGTAPPDTTGNKTGHPSGSPVH